MRPKGIPQKMADRRSNGNKVNLSQNQMGPSATASASASPPASTFTVASASASVSVPAFASAPASTLATTSVSTSASASLCFWFNCRCLPHSVSALSNHGQCNVESSLSPTQLYETSSGYRSMQSNRGIAAGFFIRNKLDRRCNVMPQAGPVRRGGGQDR